MIKLNFGSGINPLKDFVNLDTDRDCLKSFFEYNMREWNFSDGLEMFDDNSVDAATISHALMFLKVEEYSSFFSQVYRVLRPGGVFRVTEDNCEHPACGEYGLPWHGNPPSITGPEMMRSELKKAAFEVYDVPFDKSLWIDGSLIQHFHGNPPRVFHMEAIKK